LTSERSIDAPKGTTLRVYRLLLTAQNPIGPREVQRALNLSSPSIAIYHLTKLEELGLAKNEKGNYVVNKVVLEDCIRINRYLIPRFLFYSIILVATLIVEVVILRPPILTRSYFFLTIMLGGSALAFCYETFKIWRKGSL
jgi:hypothetical protein